MLHDAESGGALVRGPGGELLIMLPFERVETSEARLRSATLLAQAMSLIGVGRPAIQRINIAELGELAFTSSWDNDRKLQFAEDLRDVVAHALSTDDFDGVDAFLEASRPRPNRGVVDQARVAAIVTGFR